MIISWLFFKAHYPFPIVLSFVPVFLGTLISTYYDLQFNVFGLICNAKALSLFFSFSFSFLFRCINLRLFHCNISNTC